MQNGTRAQRFMYFPGPWRSMPPSLFHPPLARHASVAGSCLFLPKATITHSEPSATCLSPLLICKTGVIFADSVLVPWGPGRLVGSLLLFLPRLCFSMLPLYVSRGIATSVDISVVFTKPLWVPRRQGLRFQWGAQWGAYNLFLKSLVNGSINFNQLIPNRRQKVFPRPKVHRNPTH